VQGLTQNKPERAEARDYLKEIRRDRKALPPDRLMS